MLFSRFFKRSNCDDAANMLYLSMVEQARRSEFYTDYAVADSLEGRYDMIILHAFMLFKRLNACAADHDVAAKELAQKTFDFMFTDLDQNLREMGVTDLAVGKRVQKMASAFYGRAHAYDKAMGEGDAALADALTRNLYLSAPADAEAPMRMAAYVRRQSAHLAGVSDQDMLAGRPDFTGVAP